MKKQLIFLWAGLLSSLAVPFVASAKQSNDPFQYQAAYDLIGVYRAWDTTVGSSDVVVAVIDNGFDMFHPDIIDNVWKNTKEIADNHIDDDRNGYIDDVWGWNFLPTDKNGDGNFSDEELRGNNDPRPFVDGLSEQEKKEGVFSHGTVVAGIIGARGNNEIDGTGLNWNVRLMNLKIIGNTGVGSIEPLGRAIRYAVDNGAHIINISMVGSESMSVVTDAIEYAQSKGVLIVAAAGNTSAFLNQTKYYPICADAGKKSQSILGVSAVAPDRRIAAFSNVGSACIDLAAPGLNIASTVRFSPTNGLVDRYGTGYSGTSFAAPMVAGAAALIKSVQPNWKASEIMHAILSTVQHTAGQDETVYANLFGAGLLQIDKAVEYAVSQTVTAPAPPQSQPTAEQTIGVPATFPVWQRVSVGDIKSGVEHIMPNATQAEGQQTVAQLKNAHDAIRFTYDTKVYTAVAQLNKKKKVEITVYSDTWKKVQSFVTTYAESVSLAVSDTDGKYLPEIIVAPATKSTVLFSVYSFQGKLQHTQKTAAAHAGVSVAVTSDMQDMYIAYKTKKGYVLSRVTGKTEKKITDLPWITSVPALAVGDVNDDKKIDIVVGGGKGQDPSIGIYSASGVELRHFTAFDPGYRGGIDLALLDMDGNGQLEIAVAPLTGGESIKIFSEQVRTLLEWPSIAKSGSGQLRLLIQSAPLTNQ